MYENFTDADIMIKFMRFVSNRMNFPNAVIINDTPLSEDKVKELPEYKDSKKATFVVWTDLSQPIDNSRIKELIFGNAKAMLYNVNWQVCGFDGKKILIEVTGIPQLDDDIPF